jgi:hypothetical protein
MHANNLLGNVKSIYIYILINSSYNMIFNEELFIIEVEIMIYIIDNLKLKHLSLNIQSRPYNKLFVCVQTLALTCWPLCNMK